MYTIYSFVNAVICSFFLLPSISNFKPPQETLFHICKLAELEKSFIVNKVFFFFLNILAHAVASASQRLFVFMIINKYVFVSIGASVYICY